LKLQLLKTVAAVGLLVTPTIAAAQTPPATAAAPQAGSPMKGYVEAVAQSAFGNVTSQSYGGEFGFAVGSQFLLFLEAAQVRNVATSSISASAQQVAAALTQLQPAPVTYSVKQPTTIFAGGVKYLFPIGSAKAMPYALAGAGAAKVTNDVKFQLGGVDAPTSLTQFVTIGSDLSGNITKPMMTLGAGVDWLVWKQLVVDLQYRYGMIFISGDRINISRAGLGLGVAF
jgi:opacity protein-like surface antigen